MDRKDLIAKAEELDIKFPKNISDAKLAEKIAAAEAGRADAENGGSAKAKGDATSDHGSTSSGADGGTAAAASENTVAGDDTAPGTPPAAPEGDQQPTDAGSVDFAALPADIKLNVNCAIKGGRRRAGRRWAGGQTTIEASELTEDEFKALLADPMLQVKPAEIAIEA